MTTLSEYINESLTKTQRLIVGSIVIDMLKGSHVTPEQLKQMFINLDLNIIKDIEDYINTTDKENAMPYMSDSDDFLIKDNAERIIDKLCQYFSIYIVNDIIEQPQA